MADNEMNGQPHQPALAQDQTASTVNATQHMIDQMTPLVRPAVQAVLRGVITGIAGVPPHVVMNLLAFEAGHFLGQSIQGDLTIMMNYRRQIKESFEAGCKATPLVRAPSDWQPPQGGQR
jgi:hypothetical protein